VSKAAKRERQRQNRDARREYEEQIAKRRRRMRSIRNFAFLLIPFVIIFAVIALTNSSDSSDKNKSATAVTCTKVSMPAAKQVTIAAPTQTTIDPNQQYTATIDTTCGPIDVSLAASEAPVSVNSFVYLANQGFYNDLAFVRAVKTGVIQAGSASQDNAGAPPYTVQGEVPKSTPPYPIGTVAMAKTGSDPAGTVGSQFFIVTGKGFVNLPADYALLGKVTKGLDVAKKIQSFAPSSGDGPPTTVVVMNKVTIANGSGTTTTTAAPTSTTAAP
jgi:peptidyl-prolyl cis-trans isomerase B (cyclophilin B)